MKIRGVLVTAVVAVGAGALAMRSLVKNRDLAEKAKGEFNATLKSTKEFGKKVVEDASVLGGTIKEAVKESVDEIKTKVTQAYNEIKDELESEEVDIKDFGDDEYDEDDEFYSDEDIDDDDIENGELELDIEDEDIENIVTEAVEERLNTEENVEIETTGQAEREEVIEEIVSEIIDEDIIEE